MLVPSDAHRIESVSVMDHKQTVGVNSRVLDQKQQNIFDRISLFWSVELQGHPEQLNGGVHDWLIQTLATRNVNAVMFPNKRMLFSHFNRTDVEMRIRTDLNQPALFGAVSSVEEIF